MSCLTCGWGSYCFFLLLGTTLSLYISMYSECVCVLSCGGPKPNVEQLKLTLDTQVRVAEVLEQERDRAFDDYEMAQVSEGVGWKGQRLEGERLGYVMTVALESNGMNIQ